MFSWPVAATCEMCLSVPIKGWCIRIETKRCREKRIAMQFWAAAGQSRTLQETGLTGGAGSSKEICALVFTSEGSQLRQALRHIFEFCFFCNHRSNHRLWTWLWTNVSKSYFTNAPTPFITSKLLVSPHVVSYKSYGLKVNSVSAKKLKTPIPSWL